MNPTWSTSSTCPVESGDVSLLLQERKETAVVHTAELPFIWLFEGEWLVNNVTALDFEVLDMFGEMWTHFAKFGRPTVDEEWEAAESLNLRYYHIAGNRAMNRMRDQYRTEDHVVFNLVRPPISFFQLSP